MRSSEKRIRYFVRLAVASLGVTAFVGTTAAQIGWQIPQPGRSEKSPLPPTADVLREGSRLFTQHCASCHGGAGKGDGPDGDPDFPPADLTDDARASLNPDGVLFYKILNGRKLPRMPAFKNDLTSQQIWAVVEHVKSLRKPGTS
jgi:mono/diheme cytochrome c family protein